MAWVTSSPSGSLRRRGRSLAETRSRRPSDSQSMENGNDGNGTRAMTSLLPSRSTATISWATQLENQRRSSCHRGDSPKARPVNRVCTSGMCRLLSCIRSREEPNLHPLRRSIPDGARILQVMTVVIPSLRVNFLSFGSNLYDSSVHLSPGKAAPHLRYQHGML